MESRFDIDSLDSEDPFEVDAANLPHLYKHSFTQDGRPLRLGVEDLLDYFMLGDVLYFPAQRLPAHWIMTFEVEGVVVAVPLMPPRSHNPEKCRPIGLYPAPAELRAAYYRERRK